MQKKLTGKHVLIILLSAFAVVFAVNGFMAYSAVSTHTGVQHGATYQAGVHYNNTLAEQRAQDELHWSHQAQLLPDSRIAVTVTDASGSPVAGLAIEGLLERPSAKGADRRLVFKEADAGKYEAADASPEEGAWVLTFEGQKARPGATPAIYRGKERLWIGPAVYSKTERRWFGAAH
jgi:nitrogen fixation protein FixH